MSKISRKQFLKLEEVSHTTGAEVLKLIKHYNTITKMFNERIEKIENEIKILKGENNAATKSEQ